MKKLAAVIAIFVIYLCCMSASSARALHPATPLFEQPSFDAAVIFRIPQNAYVIELEPPVTLDNTSWRKVQYGSYTGYVDELSIYYLEDEGEFAFGVSRIKALSKKMGERVNIYSANSQDSDVVAAVKDGARLQLVTSSIDYGDFYELNYEGKRAFIRKQDATTGMSQNEKIAVIAGAIAAAALAGMFAMTSYVRKARKKRLDAAD